MTMNLAHCKMNCMPDIHTVARRIEDM